MSVLVVSPSAPFAEFEIGDVFLDKGKRYILLYRDPWKVKIARYTRVDEFFVKLIDRFFKRKAK